MSMNNQDCVTWNNASFLVNGMRLYILWGMVRSTWEKIALRKSLLIQFATTMVNGLM